MTTKDDLAHERIDGHEKLCERRDQETERRQGEITNLIGDFRKEIWVAIDDLRVDRNKGQRRVMYFLATVVLSLVGYIWKLQVIG